MSMKLLIVDDDLPFRERLTRSMEKKGFEVISSPGFKDSLAKVNENNFDYAVVDMRLEDGSGLELVKELKKKNLSFKDLDKEDSFDLSSSTEYLKSIKKFEKLILDLKDAKVGFYIGLYRQPRLDVAPVDITKITFKAQEDQYSTGDYLDNNVPEDYYPPEPEGFGAYQTSIKQRIYAIFVFDNPHKTLEVIYSIPN